MNDAQGQPPRLGSLAQSARLLELRGARRILIVTGLLLLLVDGYRFSTAEKRVRKDFDQRAAQAQAAGNPHNVARLEGKIRSRIRSARWIAGGFVLMGATFIVLGIALNRAPLASTVTALLLYLASSAAALLLAPDDVFRLGIVLQWLAVKIVVVLGLASAIRTAIAHRQGAQAIAAKRARFA